MTVESTTRRAQYDTNGTTGPWTVPFYFLANADLEVIYTDAAGVETTLALTTHYSVSGAGVPSGGAVTTVSSYASGGTITVLRSVAILQETDYVETDAFPAAAHETALDRLTMIAQQQGETLDRALIFPASDEASPTIPTATARASKLLGFDASGNVAVVTPNSQDSAALALSLASSSTAGVGAGQVGFNASRAYAAGTVGAELRRDVYPEQAPYNAIGDGTTDDTAAVQAALDAMTLGQTLHLTGDYKITGAGLTITNKSRINIVGPGRLKLVSANVDAVLLRLVGTCDDIKILGVRMEGDGNAGATYFQYGVWNASGQTLSNVLVAWCHFKNLNTGVSFNADTGGSYNNAWALHNTCEDMLGTLGGQGYGIHCAKVTNCHIVGNTILRAQRHSIYAARGSVTPGDDYGVLIHDNIIRDHRAAVNGVIQRPAIYCARGYGYSVKNNKIIGYYDGAIGISHDTVDGTSAGDSIVSGNQLFNRRNAVQSVWVGEAANPTSYRTKNVVISDNFFRSDIAVGGYAQEISVFNGLNVDVIDNHFFIANITNIAYRPIVLGEYAAQGALDLDRVCVMDNTLGGSISGSGYAPVRFVYCATAICSIPAGGASRVRIENNDLDEDLLTSTVEFQATQTNPKLVTRDRWGGVVGIYIAADTSPSVYGGVTQVRITNAGAISITTLDDPTPAQRVALAFTDANTTIKHATGNIRLAGGVDFVGTAKDVLTLEYSAADAQWFECGRAVNA